MKLRLLAIAVSLVVAAAALPQGPGPGQGNGTGNGNRYGYGYGRGNGPQQGGLGSGQFGPGGWWNRVEAQTPQQKQFLDQVAALHEQIRQANQEKAWLMANGASPNEIFAAQARIEALQRQLQQHQQANVSLMRQLQGNRYGDGTCDGTGPKGFGRGRGLNGNGPGNGVCDGTGPKGYGGGRGMNGNGPRGGARDGTGPRGNGQRRGGGRQQNRP